MFNLFKKVKKGFCIIHDGQIYSEIDSTGDENIVMFKRLSDAQRFAGDKKFRTDSLDNFRYINHDLKTNVATIHRLGQT